MKKFIVCGGLLLTDGMTAEERLRQNATIDNQKCQSYGAQPGTPVYIQRRTQLNATRTQAAATIAAAPPTTCTTYGRTTSCYAPSARGVPIQSASCLRRSIRRRLDCQP